MTRGDEERAPFHPTHAMNQPDLDVNRYIDYMAAADHEALEAARDEINASHFALLVHFYWHFEDWERKAGIVTLLQDHLDPLIRPIMVDFLRAPQDNDYLELAKAIALCHVHEDFDRFMAYYENRSLITQESEAFLADTAVVTQPTPLPAEAPSTHRFWPFFKERYRGYILFWLVMSLCFGVLAGLAAWESWRYTQNGVQTTAGVIITQEMLSNRADQRYRVTYMFNVELEFYMTSTYLYEDEWLEAQRTAELEVIYLADDPTQSQPASQVNHPYAVALVFLVLQLFLLLGIGFDAVLKYRRVGLLRNEK